MLKVQICIFLLVLSCHQSCSLYEYAKEFAQNLSVMLEAVKHDETELLDLNPLMSSIVDDDLTYSVNARLKYGIEAEGQLTELAVKFKDSTRAICLKYDRLLLLVTPLYTPTSWYEFGANSKYLLLREIFNLRMALTGRLKTVNLKTGLLQLLHAKLIQHSESCGSFAFELLHLIIDTVQLAILTEIKAISMVRFYSSKISSIEENFIREERIIHDPFADYVSILMKILKQAPESLRACDPPNGSWVRDESYFEMEKLMQEVIFSPNTDTDCKGREKEFNEDKSGMKYFSDVEICHGHISQCNNWKSTIGCLSVSGVKRYEWIARTDVAMQTHNMRCPLERRIDPKNEENKRYCHCQCSELTNSISLEFLQSDIKNNMVITGLRFIRKDNVLHIQPKQGRLRRNGRVDPHLHHWIDLPVATKSLPIDLGNKQFFLEDIMVPFGSVVTGVGFVTARVGTINGFGIKVQGVQFDYRTGTLHDKVEAGVTQSSNAPWTQVVYGVTNSIYNPNATHQPHSKSNEYVRLYRSSMKHDYGQSTVPLFDGVPLETDPPSPLRGIGMFHKGIKESDYAGFISLRLYPVNYQKYLEDFLKKFGVGKSDIQRSQGGGKSWHLRW